MNVLMLNGARNPKGQTARAAGALAEGVAEAGGEVEHILLPPLAIERCRQCNDDGWGLCRAEGRCVVDDDFASLVDKIAAADAVVFATPVYFSDLAESLRALLDRLRRCCMHEAGRHRSPAPRRSASAWPAARAAARPSAPSTSPRSSPAAASTASTWSPSVARTSTPSSPCSPPPAAGSAAWAEPHARPRTRMARQTS